MYRIGELAKLAGVTPDTIRYYEKQQMMDLPLRPSASCFRFALTLNITPARNPKVLSRRAFAKWSHALKSYNQCNGRLRS